MGVDESDDALDRMIVPLCSKDIKQSGYSTVGQLIDALKKFDANATVGVRASCCSHAHRTLEVRENGPDDWDGEADVVIDAAE